jgi:hypothetical protein
MRRHLTRSEAVFALRRGAAVGQFLGLGATDEGERTLRFVEVFAGSGRDPSVRVHVKHKLAGPPEFADLGELRDVAEWDPMDEDGNWLGEDPSIKTFDEPEQALAWAEELDGATTDRWVDDSMIGDEYLDALAADRA